MSILGVDVGGTFTDVVRWDGRSVAIDKVPTTPDAADAIGTTLTAQDHTLVHGTTVATNALLERAGGVTALVTSPGFEDVLEIGRQDRPSLYDSDVDRPLALVPRQRRFSTATIDEVATVAPAAVAVALMGAHIDPTEEREVAAQLRRLAPGALVSLSSEVSPEMREFERVSTTVLNSYLRPAVAGYLDRLGSLPGLNHVSVMRSSGGLMTIERAGQMPAAILLSGPAGGVTATAALAKAMGRSRVISFDMGGTSTDVSRIDNGRPPVAYERPIDGYACRLPAVAIHTVGAGGGSVAWRDVGGAIHVGPRSAGATPGPASYGRGGTEPTVTDANAVLGRLPARLAGDLDLDLAAATAALDLLELGTATEAAAGVVAVVEENMAAAIRHVSVEEGVDPSEATLMAFGGAGGLHATALARKLGISSVVVPPIPGVFSALGLLLSPPRADAAAAAAPGADEAEVAAIVAAVAEIATGELAAMIGSEPVAIDTLIDMRYRGQSHELTIDWGPADGWPALVERFGAKHLERNGFFRPDDPIEIVAVRAAAVGAPATTLADLEVAPAAADPRRGEIELIEDGAVVSGTLWWRPALTGEVVGPAIIAEPSCTTLLRSDERATVVENGALELEW